MPSQHITEESIFVPLGLSDLHILKQEWQEDGTIRVEVIALTTQATCPHYQKTCVKIHDTRVRKKRDMALRDHPVEITKPKANTCWRANSSFS